MPIFMAWPLWLQQFWNAIHEFLVVNGVPWQAAAAIATAIIAVIFRAILR